MLSWTGDLWQFFQKGGPMMWPLLATALTGIAFVIERWIALNKAKINTEEFLSNVRAALLKKKSVKEAVAVCEEYGGPIANILKAGLSRYGEREDEIERAMEIASTHELAQLERGLAVLATVSNIAPLMGFLGTVTGMIASFNTLQRQGLSDPGAVAKGISEALITTASGLAIAVPTLVCYNWFTAKISKFLLEIETGSTILLETFMEMSKSKK
jgi:biopolymer transport protein ExbB